MLSFRVAATYEIGGRPADVTVLDLNADGFLDAAAAIFDPGSATILLGDGSGALRRAADGATNGMPLGITAGALDADGLPDLVLSEFESDNLWLLRNRGGGTFDPPRLVLAGHDPWPVLAIDFDRDGRLDLVQGLVGELGGRVNVLYGNGDGSFDEPIGTRTRGGVRALAVGDVNNDGRLDVVAGNSTRASVSILLGREDGTLAPQIEVPAVNQVVGVALGDFDRDSNLDVVASSFSEGRISLSRGMGNGQFAAPEFFSVGMASIGIAAGHLDSDAHLDVVVANAASDTLSVLRGDGNGSLAEAHQFIADAMPIAVRLGDFNGDGRTDIISVNNGADAPTATVLFANDGGFDAVEQLASREAPASIAAGDLDDDALPDLAVALRQSRLVVVYLRDSSGALDRTVPINMGGAPEAVALADLNGDDLADVITVNDAPDGISVALNKGGRFASASVTALSGDATRFTSGDFDGDGNVDILAALPSGDQLALLRGRGDGSLQAPLPVAIAGRPVALGSGDFDRDGRSDAAVALSQTRSLAVLHGSAGGLRAGANVPLAGVPTAVAAVGASSVERIDLAVLQADGAVSLLRGNGKGSFASVASLTNHVSPLAIAARDVTGDGRADLLVSESSPAALAVSVASGTLQFAAPHRIRTGKNPIAAVAADLDGNGAYDLIVIGDGPNTILNDAGGPARGDSSGDGRFGAADLVATVRVSRALGLLVEQTGVPAADVNGDGSVDRQDLRALVRRLFG